MLMWRGAMRALILFGAVLLASCSGDGPANNAAVAEESSAEEVTAANDATAIDAATGEAADMAADVNYTLNEDEMNAIVGNAAGNAAANTASNSR